MHFCWPSCSDRIGGRSFRIYFLSITRFHKWGKKSGIKWFFSLLFNVKCIFHVYFLFLSFLFSHMKKNLFLCVFFSPQIFFYFILFFWFSWFQNVLLKNIFDSESPKGLRKKNLHEKGLSCLNNHFFILIFRKTLFLRVWNRNWMKK